MEQWGGYVRGDGHLVFGWLREVCDAMMAGSGVVEQARSSAPAAMLRAVVPQSGISVGVSVYQGWRWFLSSVAHRKYVIEPGQS